MAEERFTRSDRFEPLRAEEGKATVQGTCKSGDQGLDLFIATFSIENWIC